MSEVELPLKTIQDNCPPPGTEIFFAYKLKLGWVRDALNTLRGTLPALNIPLPDSRDSAECKAALAKYYQSPNALAASGAEGSAMALSLYKKCTS